MVIITDTLKGVFTDLIRASMEGEVSPLAEAHVVEVLCSFSTAPYIDSKVIHLNDLLRKASDSEGWVRKEYFRITGDLALFISGIFPDSLDSRRTWYDLGYYIDVGRIAYDSVETEVFEELACKFPEVVDVLNTVSVEIDLTSKDLARYLKRRHLIDVRVTGW